MIGPRGIAVVLVLLATALISAVALGVSLTVTTMRLGDGNFEGDVAMLHAAEAGLALSAHEMAAQADWDAVLGGSAQGAFADGPPAGVRLVPAGGWLDLARETHLLNCGRTAPCSPAQLAATTRERPWGANNPVWQPFLYGRVADLAPFARPTPSYLIVWVADDRRETDGDPAADEAEPDRPGRGIVRVRADVFGPLAARRAIEAELRRVCRVEDGVERCQPGIRVQSWREVRVVVP